VHYARVLRHKALLRKFIENSEGLVEEAYADPTDVDELFERATQGIFDLSQGAGKHDWAPLSQVLDTELVRIQHVAAHPEELTGTTTGFTGLDEKLAGLHPTDLLVLAARPAMGKTALALNIAQNAALDGGVAVGIFSLEMGRGQLVTRMLCCEAMVDANKVRTGQLDEDDWLALARADDRLRGARVHVFDRPGLTIHDVRAGARRLKQREPTLGLVVVDYLQLMSGEDPRASREQQISSISRGLKGLAKELEVPILALSQLNRGVESRKDKRPMLSDLRESGAIEQDADVILFIYRDQYYNPDSEEKNLAEVIIAKQRAGPTGMVKMVFRGQYTRFDDYAHDPLPT
jgi:replicative DNA helicase